MLNLVLSVLAITTTPVSSGYNYSKDITVLAKDSVFMQDDAGVNYDFDIQYTFYTHLDYNNEYDFSYTLSGFNAFLKVYENSVVYSADESEFFEVDYTLTPYSNYDLNYYYDDSDEVIFSIYLNNDISVSFELDFSFTAPLIFIFNDSSNVHWHDIVYTQIPIIINSDSYASGYADGQQNGIQIGASSGYQEGYTDGYNNASADSGVPAIIFGGILNVALIPVNFFLQILNFEVFGINIGGFVTGLLTLAICVILFGVIFGHMPSSNSGGNKK